MTLMLTLLMGCPPAPGGGGGSTPVPSVTPTPTPSDYQPPTPTPTDATFFAQVVAGRETKGTTYEGTTPVGASLFPEVVGAFLWPDAGTEGGDGDAARQVIGLFGGVDLDAAYLEVWFDDGTKQGCNRPPTTGDTYDQPGLPAFDLATPGCSDQGYEIVICEMFASPILSSGYGLSVYQRNAVTPAHTDALRLDFTSRGPVAWNHTESTADTLASFNLATAAASLHSCLGDLATTAGVRAADYQKP